MKLAELKRLADTKTLSLELISHYGKTGEGVPEKLRGIRKVFKSKSYGLDLVNNDGRTSELRIERACLFSVEGNILSIYSPGQRKPNDKERELLNEWNRIEKEYIENNPFGNVFLKKREFFSKSNYPYMSGFSQYSDCGKYYHKNWDLIMDKSIRGEKILVYKMHINN